MADCTYCLQPLPGGALRCPRCGTAVQQDPADSYARSGTVMERVADVQDAIREATVKQAVTPKEQPAAAKGDQRGTVGYRPVFRAPMALLTVLDDGRRDRGEAIRLRQERTVIGRVEGDVIVPHDNGVSGKHAEIVRELLDGQYHWTLRDLGSRNGSFVRVAKARLQHNQHVILGSKRYRFDSAPQGTEEIDVAESAAVEAAAGTRPWQAVSPADLAKLIPSLVELGPQGEGERLLLDRAENAVGSDPRQCNVVLANDPFVSPLHAHVSRDDRGRWTVTNNDSLNGVWLKVDTAPMNDEGEFQLGEQRFSLKIL